MAILLQLRSRRVAVFIDNLQVEQLKQPSVFFSFFLFFFFFLLLLLLLLLLLFLGGGGQLFTTPLLRLSRCLRYYY